MVPAVFHTAGSLGRYHHHFTRSGDGPTPLEGLTLNPKDRCGLQKPNLSYLPFAPLIEAAGGIAEGRVKYGPWNWREEKVSETIYADAAIRHLMQFIAGEDIDPDSGIHHVSKAIAGLVILRDAQIHGCSEDDRQVHQDLRIPEAIEHLKAIQERHEATNPDIGEEYAEEDVNLTKVFQENWNHLSTEAVDEVIRESFPSKVTERKTVAGGGSHTVDHCDVGKKARLRNGKLVRIASLYDTEDGFDNEVWPVTFALDDNDDNDCCTLTGFASIGADDSLDKKVNAHPHDVVSVFDEKDQR